MTTPTLRFLSFLCPAAATLSLDAWHVDAAAAQPTLRGRPTHTRVPCPLWAPPARRIPRRSDRLLAAPPWATSRVGRQRRVRRWCSPSCLSPPPLHRTPPPRGCPLGATAGGRLGHAWDRRGRRTPLLRRLRQEPGPNQPRPGAW